MPPQQRTATAKAKAAAAKAKAKAAAAPGALGAGQQAAAAPQQQMDDPQKINELNANIYAEITSCVNMIMAYSDWAGIENAPPLPIIQANGQTSGSQALRPSQTSNSRNLLNRCGW